MHLCLNGNKSKHSEVHFRWKKLEDWRIYSSINDGAVTIVSYCVEIQRNVSFGYSLFSLRYMKPRCEAWKKVQDFDQLQVSPPKKKKTKTAAVIKSQTNGETERRGKHLHMQGHCWQQRKTWREKMKQRGRGASGEESRKKKINRFLCRLFLFEQVMY